ncbi:hypothetical protein PI124_g2106 [Phytophthora idaei]|nr:hypothetical protein PI125_g1747 [Phytophthora idaei]KAG3172054.1 hypothetical protein PI126_g1550 [Phytophthora idaei]KAG3253307.1 hypothetical protein PI124_g2106 [Phytophthora idaei]
MNEENEGYGSTGGWESSCEAIEWRNEERRDAVAVTDGESGRESTERDDEECGLFWSVVLDR